MAGAHAGLRVKILRRASSNISWRGGASSSNGSDSARVRQPDEREEEANATAAGDLDGLWQHADQPLPHANKRQEDEDEAFNEDGSKGLAVGESASAVEADYLIGEVGVETHARTAKVSMRT